MAAKERTCEFTLARRVLNDGHHAVVKVPVAGDALHGTVFRVAMFGDTIHKTCVETEARLTGASCTP